MNGKKPKSEKARREAIKALRGKYAHLSISSAEIRQERDKDAKREDRFNEAFSQQPKKAKAA
jgi:hypothetical protein